MSDQLDVKPAHLALIKAILHTHVPECPVWAFGSRITGTAKPYSDLDLAIITNTQLPLNVWAHLLDAFSESNLPFRVDLVDWSALSDAFKNIIESQHLVINHTPAP